MDFIADIFVNHSEALIAGLASLITFVVVKGVDIVVGLVKVTPTEIDDDLVANVLDNLVEREVITVKTADKIKKELGE